MHSLAVFQQYFSLIGSVVKNNCNRRRSQKYNNNLVSEPRVTLMFVINLKNNNERKLHTHTHTSR